MALLSPPSHVRPRLTARLGACYPNRVRGPFPCAASRFSTDGFGRDLLIDTSDFRNGISIILDGEIYSIVEFQHVKPGKGGAFVRTKLKNLRAGSTLEKTFRAGEKMEQAILERK